jgi:hypothetical protein
VIDEISFVGIRIFNVIDNKLGSIKHIQNKFFGGVDVIMTSDLCQTPLVHSYDILGVGMLWKPEETRILKKFINQRVNIR